MSIKSSAYGKLGFRGSGRSQRWINRLQFALNRHFRKWCGPPRNARFGKFSFLVVGGC